MFSDLFSTFYLNKYDKKNAYSYCMIIDGLFHAFKVCPLGTISPLPSFKYDKKYENK